MLALAACGAATEKVPVGAGPGASREQGAAPTAESASRPGPYAVATYATGIPVAPDAPYVSPMIYYPSDGTPPYPGVVFAPGHNDVYLEDPPLLTQWGTLLASHGFVILFINPTDPGTGPVGRTEALKAALDTLEAENTRPDSPLQGKLDTARMAVMGHSYGGAGALFATNSNSDPRLKAAVALCPVPGNNGPSYPTDTLPSLIIGGVGDIYSAVNIQRQYRSIPKTTPKYLALYAETSDVTLGSMHLIGHSPLGTHAQDPSVARIGLAFLEVYLMGDPRYRQFLVKDSDHMSTFLP
jgi:dienelactone hydrolase